MTTKTDAFGEVLRGQSAGSAPGAADDSGDPTGVATEALNAMIEGLAAVHAVIDELSNLDGSAPDEKLPASATLAYRQALSALDYLHEEVDSLLKDHGYDLTSAFSNA